jgi:hypothetical protein
MPNNSHIKEEENALIDGYDYQRPSRSFALRTLISALGRIPANNAWKQACRKANVSEHSDEFDDLEMIFNNLSHQSGVVGVIGKSLMVRASVFKTLFKHTNQV